MDAFYASVEQLDHPAYRGRPLAVGGSSDRGVVAAASYEARRFGVRSAMSSRKAASLCPELIFAKPRFDRYQEISSLIRAIFHRYTDLVEPLSLDEAFLDVTDNKLALVSATFVAQNIKNDIRNEIGLTASAGVSYNKFLAKMASDEDKPDGLFVIRPHEATDFLDRLPIDRFFGIGKVTAEKFKRMGILNGKQLRGLGKDFLQDEFGKQGGFFYHIVRGIDERPVHASRERKSIAVERTLEKDIYQEADLHEIADRVLKQLWIRYGEKNLQARTITMKMKYSDFSQVTRSKTMEDAILSEKELYEQGMHLLSGMLPLEHPIRLLGYQLSNFVQEGDQPKYLQTTIEF